MRISKKEASDFAGITAHEKFVAGTGRLRSFKKRHDAIGKVVRPVAESIDREDAEALG